MKTKAIVCYAACLGNCCNVQSREHYISKGLWNNNLITFEGLPWLDGEPKIMAVKKVFRKILCETHNNALSDYDKEGIKLFRTSEKFHHNQHLRGKLKKSTIWKTDRETIQGRNLERLMAKVAIGILQEFPEEKWHLTNTPSINPPEEIVKAIYGLSDFEYPAGLYYVGAVGDRIQNVDKVSISTLYDSNSKGYIGSLISYRDWQFFINLSDVDMDESSLRSQSGVIVGKNGSPAIYHPRSMNFDVGSGNGGGKLSGIITFEW